MRKVHFRSRGLKIVTLSTKVVRKVHFRSWGSKIFARSSIDFVAGAAFSQGQVPISWQAQHFRKVKCKIRGRRITFARSSTEFVAGAALSQGQVQILWQAQHVSKVKHTFGGRRSIFARSTFAAGARKSQLLSTKVVREVNFRSWGFKIATFKYESSAQSPLSQLLSSKVVREVNFRGLNIATFKCRERWTDR